MKEGRINLKHYRISNLLLQFHSLIVMGFIYFPILVLIVFSFNKERINAVWTGFTFDWYVRLLNDSDLIAAVLNSLTIGIVSTIVATFLGTMAALAMHRYQFKMKQIFDAILYLPIVIPEIVMAVAMLSFYVFIHLSLGLISVIIAHISFNISFVFVVVYARLAGMNRDLENAARDLGATSFQTFRHITFPLILPGIIAGALLAFTISWDDFLIAFFTAGVGATTLPMKVYSMIKFGVSPEINAISTITILFTMILILLAVRLEGIFTTAKTLGK